MNAPAIRYADIAIVGGGLGGLIAAVTARRQLGGGADVIVLEGSDPGGRARCDERAGFVFNRGPRALYLGGPAEAALAALGVDVTAGGPPASAKAMAWTGGRLVPLPQGPTDLLRTPLFRGRDRARMGRLLSRLGRLDAESARGSTVAAWVDSLGLGADAAALVHMLVRVATYTNAPHLVEASAAIANLNTAFGPGVRYLDGGWQTLIDQLHRRAGEVGVDVCGDVAVSVEPDGDMTLVTTTAGQVRAAAVVLAAGSAVNCTALLGHVPDGWDVSSQPVNIACLELGLRRPPAHRVVLGVDEPLYLSTHSPPAALAPAGGAVAHAMVYLPPDDAMPSSARRAQLEDFVRATGVSDDDVVTQRFLAKMPAHTAMPRAHPRGLDGRPGVYVAGMPGVFVAGDWVGDRGLLADAVASSATAAGRAAAAHSSATLVA